ncbi:Uncharacterised protein [Serratia rubidaea]|uniref:Uncharacterized protein n=1 Tax=Serratia rubidaea TaxID=61652 RepID=A0A4U9HH25_SERRU|nr:Uncharacterised protein [Serratia rubidaea]
MSMQFTHAIRGNFFDIAACVEQPDQLAPSCGTGRTACCC